jgi:nucleoside-diphosphate-sugar epimerase
MDKIKKENNNSFLLTGAAGFIGANLAEAPIKQNTII